MHALRARDDLLPADEHVERVAVLGGLEGAGHGVEGADGQGEAVQDEKVGAVFWLFFVGRRRSFILGGVVVCILVWSGGSCDVRRLFEKSASRGLPRLQDRPPPPPHP